MVVCSPRKCLYKCTGNEVLGSPDARYVWCLQPLLRSFAIGRTYVRDTQVFVPHENSLPVEELMLPVNCSYVPGGSTIFIVLGLFMDSHFAHRSEVNVPRFSRSLHCGGCYLDLGPTSQLGFRRGNQQRGNHGDTSTT